MSPDEFIKHWGIGAFFHFTDESNLPSIKTNNGLYCLAQLQERGIKVPRPGGNEWSHEADTREGLDKYVHLCLTTSHPMEYIAKKDGRIQKVKYLQICPSILCFDGIRLTADISNKRGVALLTLDEAIEQMDFEIIYTRTNWRDPEILARRKAAEKYELLVPSCIPLQFIRGF